MVLLQGGSGESVDAGKGGGRDGLGGDQVMQEASIDVASYSNHTLLPPPS